MYFLSGCIPDCNFACFLHYFCVFVVSFYLLYMSCNGEDVNLNAIKLKLEGFCLDFRLIFPIDLIRAGCY